MSKRARQPKEFTSLMIDTESRDRLRKLAGSQPVAGYIRNLTFDLLTEKPEKDPLLEKIEEEVERLHDQNKEIWERLLRVEARNLELNWLNHSWAVLYAEERKRHLSPDSPEYKECEEIISKSESSWKDFRNKVLEDYNDEKGKLKSGKKPDHFEGENK